MGTRNRAAATGLGLALLVLTNCGWSEDSRSLTRIEESGTLIVATRNAPTTWYIGPDDQATGPEHDLVHAFADSLDVEVEFRFYDTIAGTMSAVAENEVDFAAAGLTITEERQERFRFGPPYQAVKQQLVCRRGGPQPQTPAEMVGPEIHVTAESAYVDRLEELQEQHPDLSWQEREDATTEMLLQEVWDRELACTVADSTIARMNRRLFPELVLSQDLTDEQQLGWALPRERRDVARAMDNWLTQYKEAGKLERHQDRYYGHYQEFDYVNIRRLMRRIGERFRRYEQWFRAAGEQYDLPFTLLAALSYQESHWNPKAVSPTGVRGLMMLTQRTAREVGVENRLDPRQAIFGGAQYLDAMRKRISEQALEPDRTFLALAAYNVGRGHLHDAQSLARELDRDPYNWTDMSQVLPLLADPAYYKDLRYGYARGHEPVLYVSRIREYWRFLEDYLYGHPAFPQ